MSADGPALHLVRRSEMTASGESGQRADTSNRLFVTRSGALPPEYAATQYGQRS